MQNRYAPNEAESMVAAWPGCPPELALRVYTSRLLGAEEDLVLHGGGNTSVKCRITNLLGEEQEVIFVKGSGWDLKTIEPVGFSGLDLAYLRKLRRVGSLSDAEMVNQFRTHLLDSASPDPSIETMVHAFLPHRFIDHTHADAIVSISNRDDSDQHLRAALGENIGILPFIMPGQPLALAMIELYEQNPKIACVILKNHGIFTFAEEAKTAYGLMIEMVSRAEAYLTAKKVQSASAPAKPTVPAALALPVIRGALSLPQADGFPRVMQLCLDQSEEVMAALARPDAKELFSGGVLTPDHVIRTKNYPLWLDLAGLDEEGLSATVRTAMADYQEDYRGYFLGQTEKTGLSRIMLDPKPRVILAPGLGLISAGFTAKDAAIAADIARHTLRAKLAGAGLGPYRELDRAGIFAMEYWDLEQAKLGKTKARLLEGRAAVVTGGAGAIGLGIGRQLLEAGARVFMADLNEEGLAAVCEKLAAEFGRLMVLPLVMDVTSEASVAEAMDQIILSGGGLDILVPNAGIAQVATIAELDETAFRRVIEVNCLGVFQVIKAAIPIFTRQGSGGAIVINSSKNVFDPGASFGAYSASKAGAHQLGKIAALELAAYGVRVNMINADAIFEDDGVPSGLWEAIGPERMRARDLDPAGLREYYRQRNLLKTEVRADQVGRAVVFFASGQTPTTGATLPVDGGIPAAFPR